MENIINQRAKKEAHENKKIFLQGIDLKLDDLLSNENILKTFKRPSSVQP